MKYGFYVIESDYPEIDLHNAKVYANHLDPDKILGRSFTLCGENGSEILVVCE